MSTKGTGHDWREFANIWPGRWIFMPIAISIAAIVGFGLILFQLGLDDLPKIAYSAPGAIAATMYYGIELRKVLTPGAGGEGLGGAMSRVSTRIFGRNNTVVVHSGAKADETRGGPRDPS